jgi:hypothetical protein
VDSGTYRIGDPIRIRASLKNISRNSVCVYSDLEWGALGGFDLKIKSKSMRVFPKEHDHDMVVPSNLDKRDHYACLFPEHFIGRDRIEAVGDFFPTPGRYEMWFEYVSPVSAGEAVVKDRFFARSEGALESNRVTVTILPSD